MGNNGSWHLCFPPPLCAVCFVLVRSTHHRFQFSSPSRVHSTMTTSTLRSISQEYAHLLTCYACGESLLGESGENNPPITLSCGHTFCWTCGDAITLQDKPNCVFCNVAVEHFASNHGLLELLLANQRNKDDLDVSVDSVAVSSTTGSSCELNSSVDADSGKSKDDSASEGSQPSVCSGFATTSSPLSQFCSRHPDKPLHSYCIPCFQQVCEVCSTESHIHYECSNVLLLAPDSSKSTKTLASPLRLWRVATTIRARCDDGYRNAMRCKVELEALRQIYTACYESTLKLFEDRSATPTAINPSDGESKEGTNVQVPATIVEAFRTKVAKEAKAHFDANTKSLDARIDELSVSCAQLSIAIALCGTVTAGETHERLVNVILSVSAMARLALRSFDGYGKQVILEYIQAPAQLQAIVTTLTRLTAWEYHNNPGSFIHASAMTPTISPVEVAASEDVRSSFTVSPLQLLWTMSFTPEQCVLLLCSKAAIVRSSAVEFKWGNVLNFIVWRQFICQFITDRLHVAEMIATVTLEQLESPGIPLEAVAVFWMMARDAGTSSTDAFMIPYAQKLMLGNGGSGSGLLGRLYSKRYRNKREAMHSLRFLMKLCLEQPAVVRYLGYLPHPEPSDLFGLREGLARMMTRWYHNYFTDEPLRSVQSSTSSSSSQAVMPPYSIMKLMPTQSNRDSPTTPQAEEYSVVAWEFCRLYNEHWKQDPDPSPLNLALPPFSMNLSNETRDGITVTLLKERIINVPDCNNMFDRVSSVVKVTNHAAASSGKTVQVTVKLGDQAPVVCDVPPATTHIACRNPLTAEWEKPSLEWSVVQLEPAPNSHVHNKAFKLGDVVIFNLKLVSNKQSEPMSNAPPKKVPVSPRVKPSEAEEAPKPFVRPDQQPLTCPRCTYINSYRRSNCEICYTELPIMSLYTRPTANVDGGGVGAGGDDVMMGMFDDFNLGAGWGGLVLDDLIDPELLFHDVIM